MSLHAMFFVSSSTLFILDSFMWDANSPCQDSLQVFDYSFVSHSSQLLCEKVEVTFVRCQVLPCCYYSPSAQVVSSLQYSVVYFSDYWNMLVLNVVFYILLFLTLWAWFSYPWVANVFGSILSNTQFLHFHTLSSFNNSLGLPANLCGWLRSKLFHNSYCCKVPAAAIDPFLNLGNNTYSWKSHGFIWVHRLLPFNLSDSESVQFCNHDFFSIQFYLQSLFQAKYWLMSFLFLQHILLSMNFIDYVCFFTSFLHQGNVIYFVS